MESFAAIVFKRSGVANVAAQDIDIDAEVVRLEGLTTFELRQEWVRLYNCQAPQRYARELLIRAITYKMQESVFSGLSKAQLRKLLPQSEMTSDKSGRRSVTRVIKPGTRLVREWRGVTHSVLVLDDGVEWNGRRYRSLSVVAREITGAHWSGPRFFGLTGRERQSDE